MYNQINPNYCTKQVRAAEPTQPHKSLILTIQQSSRIAHAQTQPPPCWQSANLPSMIIRQPPISCRNEFSFFFPSFFQNNPLVPPITALTPHRLSSLSLDLPASSDPCFPLHRYAVVHARCSHERKPPRTHKKHMHTHLHMRTLVRLFACSLDRPSARPPTRNP